MVEEMAINKVLIIGVGGVGSWIAEFLARATATMKIDLTLMDFDEVEEKNLLYSNFKVLDILHKRKKVEALLEKFAEIQTRKLQGGEKHILTKKFESPYDLEPWIFQNSLVVIATDEFITRQLVHETCENWIDVRAEGQYYQIFTNKTPKNIIDEFTNGANPEKRASCQLDPWIRVDMANIVCAAQATQIILSMIRGEEFQTQIFGRI